MKTSHLFAVLATATAALTAQSTLVLPSGVTPTTEGSTSNTFPWDRDSATASSNDIRVQTVYDSTSLGVAFPIVITQLRFRANATTATWAGGTYSTVNIRMGESAVDYAALTSTGAFDANYVGGTSPAPVYAGPVTVVGGTGNGTGVPGPWYITVPLTTPFLYDPTTGNDLLIDIAHDGVFSTTSGSAATDAGTVLCRRVSNSTDWQATNATAAANIGIVCELTYVPASGIFSSFTVDRSEIGPGETVQFTDTSFTSNPSGITAWAWDFDNDGNVDSTVQNPTWQFNGCGVQNVSLRVFDAVGTDVTTRPAVNVLAPEASFTLSFVTTTPPFVVQFTDTSTRNPQSWSWDLDGDGIVDSTAQNPAFVYPNLAVTTVSLTAGNACGTDVATQVVVTANSLQTQFGGIAGWDSGGAFYIDVNVTNPAGITVGGIGVQVQNPGIQADINVYVKPGLHAGFETDRNAWAFISTGGNPSSAGTPNETIMDVTDFSLPAGQWSLAIEYVLASGRFNYTTTGATNAANADLALSGGAMFFPAFVGTTTFSPRNWNGAIYYATGQTGGLFQVIGDGCANTLGTVASIGIQGGGVPRVGQALNLEVTGGPLSQPASVIVFGFTSLGGIDLSVLGMPGCLGWPSPDLLIPTPTDALGVGAAGFPVPNSPAIVGANFWVQGLFLDVGANPFGFVVGDAGQGTVGQ